MTARFISLEDRVSNLNNCSDTSSSIQPAKAFQSARHPNPHRTTDKYDYNPNILRKSNNNASSQLNTWNLPLNSREDSVSQYSNRGRDAQATKDSQRRASTVENLSSRSSRQDDNQVRLEIALYKHQQYLADQVKYREELTGQVEDKQRKKHNDKVKDLKANNSGLLIGEVHEGLDIDGYTKNMRIRRNNKAIKKILDRSFTNHERSVSSQGLRDLNSHKGYSSVNYPTLPQTQDFDASLIEERDEEEYESIEKYSPEFHQRRVNRENHQKQLESEYPSYSELTAESRHHLKKAHHQKLKNSIKNQIKKHEDYTKKLHADQQKRKQEFNQALEGQVAVNQFKKKAASHKEKLSEKNNENDRPSTQPADKAWDTKHAILNDIEQKYRMKLAREANKSEDQTKHLGQDGRYKRLIDDTVKRILIRQSKGQSVGRSQEKL